MNAALTYMRSHSPIVAMITGLVWVQAGCSLTNLDQLQSGDSQDGAIGDSPDTSTPNPPSSGGATAAGGVPAAGGDRSGGIATTGGATMIAGTTGGSTVTGGTAAIGGTTRTSATTGGSSSTGGATGSGKATGGTTAPDAGAGTGGRDALATGGVLTGGGGSASGGSTRTGGVSSPGNTTTVGGTTNAGGTTAKGGTTSAGGSTATGGTTSTGVSTAAVTTTCPGAVPAGITSSWCSCAQYGQWANGGYKYYNNIWGSGVGPQCIWATADKWGVAANHPTTSGVKSYPNISLSPAKAIVAIKSYTSSFNVTVPTTGSWNAAYDLWVKGGNSTVEIMLWMNKNGEAKPIASSSDASGPVADRTNVSVGGHTWNVYFANSGSNDVVSFVRTSNITSGSVDIQAILLWIIANNTTKYGVFTSSWRLDQVQFGFVIDADGATQSFVTNSYSVTSS